MLRFYFYMLFLLTVAACHSPVNAQDISKSTTELSVSVKTKDASNKESKDGYVLLDITGGIPPYQVNIFSSNSTKQTKETLNTLEIKDLTPGPLLLIIQDSSKKLIQQTVTISTKN